MNALLQTAFINAPAVLVRAEQAEHGQDIDSLVDLNFGPDRFRKTAYRLRDGLDPLDDLGLVATQGSRLIGTIRFWQVAVQGVSSTLLLGPIAIHPDFHGRGIGRALMNASLENAKAQGWDAVILVGDEPYYRRFGFTRSLVQNLALPGPVDLARFLGLELVDGALKHASGMVGRVEV
ncbi:GNAT family N-acetyltransferase [Magnetovibrio blakemorei]|uniref:GNAT family N-acetyltransferase n=1 Tax=Magnetovibrio blakemorei TaxID=28181 RepID=UPI000ACF5CF6|nr:N-acetyltransferase [Magnetovibrio blakemorei]